MAEFVIEDGVPIPPKKTRRGVKNAMSRNNWKQLACTMRPRQSVLVPVQGWAATLVKTGRELGMKFTYREEDGKFRVWREL